MDSTTENLNTIHVNHPNPLENPSTIHMIDSNQSENPSTIHISNPHQPEPSSTIHMTGSDSFVQWLHDQNVSLAFSSYQLGKFFLIGRHPPAGLSIFQRNFTRCMGITTN